MSAHPDDLPLARNDRRHWLFAGVGLAAGVIGAAGAWWRYRPHGIGDSTALWGLEFDKPAGGSVAMQAFRGRPLLVNFWATWCPPCIEELPLVDRFFRENTANGWQVIGLAVDQPSAVRRWLSEKPLAFPVGMAGMGGTDLAKRLGNDAGGLPFTVVFDAGGNLLARKMGQLTAADLAGYKEKIR